MAKTYEQIQQQIEKLQVQAKALQAVEAKGVILRIKEAIEHYGLTAEQLGFHGSLASATTATTANAASATPSASKATSVPAVKQGKKQVPNNAGKGKSQFSDDSGNVWGGRGPRPAWLRAALQGGHDINEFRTGQRAKAKKALMPPGAAIAAASPSTPAAATPPAAPRRAKTSYADDAGHAWSGMGPKPAWLKAAIDAGKSLADFAK